MAGLSFLQKTPPAPYAILPTLLFFMENPLSLYHTIHVPLHPKPDTIVAVFLLRTFGETHFPGVSSARLTGWQQAQNLDQPRDGIISIGIPGGTFFYDPEHHTTNGLAHHVAEHLAIHHDPALKKLLEFAARDGRHGRGTISSDPLDRAFGITGLTTSLNRQYPDHPGYVVEAVLPFISAHYHEQALQHHVLPQEFSKKIARGNIHQLSIKQDKKNIRAVVLDSEHRSFPGYLRSQAGGAYDIVVQRQPSGHILITTRPAKKIDLRCFTTLVRIKELMLQQRTPEQPFMYFAQGGSVPEVPEWYFDTTTNTLSNLSIHHEVPPSRLTVPDLITILEVGISKTPWEKISGEPQNLVSSPQT
jgi:hypothetical protein